MNIQTGFIQDKFSRAFPDSRERQWNWKKFSADRTSDLRNVPTEQVSFGHFQ